LAELGPVATQLAGQLAGLVPWPLRDPVQTLIDPITTTFEIQALNKKGGFSYFY
jgi:hypothetical protein